MPPRLSLNPVRLLWAHTGLTTVARAPFCASARIQRDDSSTNVHDLLADATTSRPQRKPVSSRSQYSPTRSGFTNPSSFEIPSTTSVPRNNRPTGVSERSRQGFDGQLSSTLDAVSLEGSDVGPKRGPGADLVDTLRRSGLADKRIQEAISNKARTSQLRQVEAQVSRTWRDGDVYAPHDLSPVEMQKARMAKTGMGATNSMVNTRKKGGRDVLDDLGIDPLKEYKNFSLMSEFVSELGRIKHSRETGLRAVNQRRMAKAVRRAIGIGIMPSVHRHPELEQERLELRKR